VLAVESVTAGDLEDCLAEAWFEACLRRGAPATAFDEVEAALAPVFQGTRPGLARSCRGFTLRVRGHTSVFSFLALELTAQRAQRSLRASGSIAAGESLSFEVVAEAAESGPEIVARPGHIGPPDLFECVLPEGGETGAEDYPVFYTRTARELAERIARKGGAKCLPVETGGLLVGRLCRCPESGEIFAIVEDVLAATAAREEPYSLTFSGATWARMQRVMEARRRSPGTRGQRILGQAHGHSFLPLDEQEPDTAFLSEEDLRWCRAVFRGEPWQLSQVFGLNARGGRVDAQREPGDRAQRLDRE